MAYFVVKRFGQMLMVMVFASFLLFLITSFSPVKVEKNMLGPYASQEQYRIVREKLQLDDPLFVRYFRWMGVLFGVIPDPLSDPAVNLGFEDPVRGPQYFGNFGYSRENKTPVNDLIWDRLANTGRMAAVAFAIIVPLSLTIGVLAGMREGSRLDRTLSMSSIVTTSVPEFATGVLLMALFVFQIPIWLDGKMVLPGVSTLTPGEWPIWTQFVMPAMTLVIYDFGYVARIVRGSMVEVMTQPYIRTAVLKGLKYREVIVRHALRNAMIAPFTVILLQINWLMSGVVVVETLFRYPGIGRLVLQAALFGDIAVIQATTMIAVVLVTLTQFIGDVGYMLLNPRIRFA